MCLVVQMKVQESIKHNMTLAVNRNLKRSKIVKKNKYLEKVIVKGIFNQKNRKIAKGVRWIVTNGP